MAVGFGQTVIPVWKRKKNITILGSAGAGPNSNGPAGPEAIGSAITQLQSWVLLGQNPTLMVPVEPNTIRSWLLQRLSNPVWLTNSKGNAPHRRYNVCWVWLGIDTFWKCFGFGLSTRPNSAGSGYQSQIQRLVAEKATPSVAIVD